MKTLLIAYPTVVLLAAANLAPEPLRRDRTPRRRAKNALHVGNQQNFVGKEHLSRMIG
jgi:hypothetical protein